MVTLALAIVVTRVRRTNHTTRRGVLGAVGAAVTAGLAGCAGITEGSREQTDVEHTVSEDVDRLSVDVGDADVTVDTWDNSDVQIEATKYAIGQTELSEVSITREVVSGALTVGVERTDSIQVGTVGGGAEAIDVRVPSDVQIDEISADDGEITVDDVSGDLAVAVDDADVTVAGPDTVRGELDDGSLELMTPATIGDVTAADAEIDVAVADTDGDTAIRVDDGAVTARLASELDATVVVEGDGTVNGLDALDSVETSGEMSLTGRAGDGGDELRIVGDDAVVDFQSA